MPRRLRICHVFGNWKWTGPADPVVSLAAAQAQRHEVSLLLGGCPFDDLEHGVAAQARRRGLSPTILQPLRKHLNPWRVLKTTPRVREWIGERNPDLVHVHLDGDHVVALRSLSGLGDGGPRLVRTVHDGFGEDRLSLRRRLLFRKTDGLLTPSRGMRERLEQELPQIPSSLIPGTVDLSRFTPNPERRKRGRARLGLAEKSLVFGIVARIQRHRRFETLLQAFKRAIDEGADLSLVILGRGTHAEELVEAPATEMGIRERLFMPGYQDGEDYVETLSALDAAIFLVPGTDGSCRAVREEMAVGLPVLVSNQAPLPEMIEPGRTGEVVETSVTSLCDVMKRWDQDRDLVEEMGRSAAKEAHARFSIESSCDAVDALYERVGSMGVEQGAES